MPLICGTHIYFEGPDRAGKTSMRKSFSTLSKQQYITFDRGIISQIVYDILFDRNNLNFTDLIDSIANSCHLSVFCLIKMDPNDMADLCIKTNEPVTMEMVNRSMTFSHKTFEESAAFNITFNMMKQYVSKKKYNNIIFIEVLNKINHFKYKINDEIIRKITTEIDDRIYAVYHDQNLYTKFIEKMRYMR